MDQLAAFALGYASGMMSFFAITLYLASKSIAKRKKLQEEVQDYVKGVMNKPNVVEERMKKVKDITLRQLDLQSQVETPQKSGLDGKYKNILGSEIRALEEEKVALLNSILADGHDPVLTVGTLDGGTETLKLSEFMAQQGLLKPVTPPPPTTGPTPKKFGKFVVYSNDDKGGKSET